MGDETLISKIFDAVPIPLYFKDRAGIYRVCNPAFAKKILGLEREQVLGKGVFDLVPVIPTHLAQIYYQSDEDLMERGGSVAYEVQVNIANEGARDYMIHKNCINDDAGNCIGLVGVMNEIEERKNLHCLVTEAIS